MGKYLEKWEKMCFSIYIILLYLTTSQTYVHYVTISFDRFYTSMDVHLHVTITIVSEHYTLISLHVISYYSTKMPLKCN